MLQARPPARYSSGAAAQPLGDESPQSNRRGFLKLAGAAAVGATVAAKAGSTQQAAAGTGGDLVIGTAANTATNTATNIADVTHLFSPSATFLMPAVFRADNYSIGSLTLPSNHRIAIAATVSGNDLNPGYRTGVYARTSGPAAVGGQGVFGSHEGVDNPFATNFSFGVVGTTESGGYGMFGYNPTGTTSVGVLGRADAGIGVIASSFTGLSLLVRDGGRMQQQLRTTGAPTTGTFNAGEQIRDGLADLYICTVGGTPGTWRKVTAQHPAYANAGGSLNLLPRPIRLLDTRPSTTAPINNGFAKLAANTELSLQISGTVADSLSVPSGAKGILGNITITGATAAGYALVWSADQPTPLTSNINFRDGDQANYFISAIDAAGKLKVLASAATNVLIDVFGFVF